MSLFKNILSVAAASLVFVLFVGHANLAQAGTTTYRNAVLAHNPILYYEFEEQPGAGTAINSGTLGAAGNGTYVNTTLGGNEVGAAVGLLNGGLFAASNSYVDVPNLGGNYTQVTIETWVNADGLAGGCCTSIYSTDAFSNTALGKSLHYNIKSGRDVEHALAGGAPQNVNTAGGLIQDDTWYHFVATYDGTTGLTEIYVNGNQEASVVRATGDLNLSDAQLTAWNTGRNLPGHMDEFVIYDKLLTGQEIEDIFEAANVTATPEPSTFALAAFGLLGLGMSRRRRRR